MDRADYPILKGISRSAGGAVLTLDIALSRSNATMLFEEQECVVSIRGARIGAVGRVQRVSKVSASVFVEFNGAYIEKLIENLRLATDTEILAARLQGLL